MYLECSKNSAFTDRFLRHLDKFIQSLSLFDKKQDLYIGCSGGADSMALVHCVYQLRRFGYSNKLTCIHINHGTRDSQIIDEKLVKKFCNDLSIPIEIFHLDGLKDTSNFEKAARDARYKCFQQSLHNSKKSTDRPVHKPRLLLAHHIDDSFEWALMQSLRSSQLKSSIGIPVINGYIVRPFMCVTRKQIMRYVDYFNIPYLDDPTNLDKKYERNFLRHDVIGSIKLRYAKFLKHYVHRQNELAKHLGIHALKINSSFVIKKNKNSVLLYSTEFPCKSNGLREQIRDVVHSLSSKNNRGQLQQQLDRALEALANNKQGPLSFSGGVQLVINFNQLLLFNKGYQNHEAYYLKNYDLNDAHLMQRFTLKEFMKALNEILQHHDSCHFPFWVIIENNAQSQSSRSTRWVSGQKRIHPLWPELTSRWIEDGVLFSSGLALVHQWLKAANCKKSLRLRFLIAV